ncbi:MAG: hypothetical protein F4Z10_04660 [Synechococcus sp. SB0666_bin_14]|nr:hypothetical protein [Synechococcus sp. SB0666_bin_14]MYA91633.1 hypothetical protein [Synechococcus sp. SB0663_bin_10]MYG46911.1 hypothetical protein [Synechococcus sp. SB0675_bin_6]MYJ58952.1 hypothetical protein [Synechococcus sp. SB0672_bin_6]MYK90546.1 hypothetical protein [Synechococcus sp. SB0669_bin_8]
MGQYPRQSRDFPARDRVGARSKHGPSTRTVREAGFNRIPVRTWLLWLVVSIVGVSAVTVGALVALAPTLTDSGEAWRSQDQSPQGSQTEEPLRVDLDGKHFYQLDLDPRQVEFGLLRGWDREQEAFADPDALAFISGPMYERYYWPDPRLEQIIDQTVQPSSPQRAADQGYTDSPGGPEVRPRDLAGAESGRFWPEGLHRH